MTAKIRTLIIEDEEPARNLLRTFLESFEEIDLIGECSDGFSGLKTINELQPDLVFLDIQMPRLTGFELLELLDDIPEIVFTTAYDEYALKAFDLNAVDYLMKPFSKQRLRQAVDKVIERFRIKSSGKEKVSQLVEQMHQKARPLERIVVKSGSKIHVIPIQDIEQLEAQDDYVMIHTAQGRFMKKETMASMEQNLPEDSFIRIHRSHIVNVSQIQRIEQYGKESYLLILKNGNQVSVSKSRIKDLKRELDF
ncbi:MAG: LytTR family transcriptional regulator DNA-binding domain-containing protein [Bacteroidales bacterium]|jgi:two-component system, LytTR family, response regulator|nr:LytTR family transcriptional regulator DNA-binding domain-containing protein [Bacteroidota bacterium]MDO8897697.1 LytTR family transcriptional regulator DNA-binding domain-containing protein [Bacteroidales bacterium]